MQLPLPLNYVDFITAPLVPTSPKAMHAQLLSFPQAFDFQGVCNYLSLSVSPVYLTHGCLN